MARDFASAPLMSGPGDPDSNGDERQQAREPRAEGSTMKVDSEEQIAAFIDKFEPDTGDLIRSCRTALRKLLPTAFELIYDNYNFFVIGYCSTAKPSTCIVSLAAACR